jgi:hypothetical protein
MLVRVPPAEYTEKWQTFLEYAEFLDLSPADRHLAWRDITGDDDWFEWPVPIEYFYTDPFYIGKDVVIRDVIGGFLRDFWDAKSDYQVWVFIGGIGSGKSFSAAISITYALYQLSCMKKPQRYLSGFPGCQISTDAEIVLMNASAAGAEQSKKIVYGEAFEKITRSPYFNTYFEHSPRKTSELEFPNRIRLSPGTSDWRSALGWNLYGFAVDEAAFGRETERADYVKELFLALNQRRRSRFGSLGFGGLFTSPGGEAGFVELLATESGTWDTSILLRRIETWTAKGELKPRTTRVFLLDRNPDHIRIVEEDLLYVAPGICQRKDGSIIRYAEPTQEQKDKMDAEETRRKGKAA